MANISITNVRLQMIGLTQEMLEVSVALLEKKTNPTALVVSSCFSAAQTRADYNDNHSMSSKNYEPKQPRKEIRSEENIQLYSKV